MDWEENDYGRIVAPGLGIYFLSPEEQDWPLTDITREMEILRQIGLGYTFFRGKFFTDNIKGIYNFTKNFNISPALVPIMTWEHKVPTDTVYNIYVSDHYPVDINNSRNLVIGRLPKKEMEKYLIKINV